MVHAKNKKTGTSAIGQVSSGNTVLRFVFMKLFVRPVDLASVNTIVYHLPDGPTLSLNIDGIDEFIDLELEQGHYCDTSDIDGTLHFFPKGNA